MLVDSQHWITSAIDSAHWDVLEKELLNLDSRNDSMGASARSPAP